MRRSLPASTPSGSSRFWGFMFYGGESGPWVPLPDQPRLGTLTQSFRTVSEAGVRARTPRHSRSEVRLLLGAFDPFQDRGVFRRVFGEPNASAMRQGRGPGDAFRLRTRRRFAQNQAVLGIRLVHHVQYRRERPVEQRVRRMAMHAGIPVAAAPA